MELKKIKELINQKYPTYSGYMEGFGYKHSSKYLDDNFLKSIIHLDDYEIIKKCKTHLRQLGLIDDKELNEKFVMSFSEFVNEQKINENFEVFISDGMRYSKKFTTKEKALNFSKDLIKNNSNLQEISIYSGKVTNTSEVDNVIAWWSNGSSYLSNLSKKDLNLASKKLNESSTIETISFEDVKDEQRGRGSIQITFNPSSREYSYVAKFENGKGDFRKPNDVTDSWDGKDDLFNIRKSDILKKFQQAKLNESGPVSYFYDVMEEFLGLPYMKKFISKYDNLIISVKDFTLILKEHFNLTDIQKNNLKQYWKEFLKDCYEFKYQNVLFSDEKIMFISSEKLNESNNKKDSYEISIVKDILKKQFKNCEIKDLNDEQIYKLVNLFIAELHEGYDEDTNLDDFDTDYGHVDFDELCGFFDRVQRNVCTLKDLDNLITGY